MKSAVKNSVLILAVAFCATTACRRDARDKTPEKPPASAGSDSVVSVDGMTGEEIFRRAFWRQPTAGDRIVQAWRREQRASIGDPATVTDWIWFIELHPSPELLAALRDPETFGLLRLPPGAPPRAWTESAESSAWFPTHATLAFADFEILQAPTGLTVLYRATDNTLYATDTGKGFAAPVSRPK